MDSSVKSLNKNVDSLRKSGTLATGYQSRRGVGDVLIFFCELAGHVRRIIERRMASAVHEVLPVRFQHSPGLRIDPLRCR
jgi:ABC-type sulfate transport system substrate-binding protein